MRVVSLFSSKLSEENKLASFPKFQTIPFKCFFLKQVRKSAIKVGPSSVFSRSLRIFLTKFSFVVNNFVFCLPLFCMMCLCLSWHLFNPSDLTLTVACNEYGPHLKPPICILFHDQASSGSQVPGLIATDQLSPKMIYIEMIKTLRYKDKEDNLDFNLPCCGPTNTVVIILELACSTGNLLMLSNLRLLYLIVVSKDLDQKMYLYPWKIPVATVTVSNILAFYYYFYKSAIFLSRKKAPGFLSWLNRKALDSRVLLWEIQTD